MSDKINLNKRTVEALPVPTEGREEYRDTGNRYLRMVVSAEGRRTWRYVRKVSGRVRFVTVGVYPETTPDMARREAARLSAEYDAGRDPGQSKRDARKVTTWPDLFAWYMENHSKPNKRTWQYDVDMDGLYCGAWRGRPVGGITTDTINRWHKQIGRDKGKHQADRVLAMVKTVFSKAAGDGVTTCGNPAQHVRKFYGSAKEYGRVRNLNGDEVKRLLLALANHHDADMADFFTVCLFTGARRGNVQAMRWADMDRTGAAPSWIIPATESKNKEPMVIPLAEPVPSILNRRWKSRASDEWVFPSKRSGKCPHLSEPKKAWSAICAAAALRDVRIHDLRRTLGSWQASLGASLQVIGRSLGHRSTQSTEVYARLNIDPVRASVTGAARAMLETANKQEVTK